MLHRIPSYALIVLPGLLFWLAWPPMTVFIFLFLAFIPLFELAKRNAIKSRARYFFHLYLALFIWNVSTTWWVWNSTAWGCVVMLICNPLLMMVPWVLARWTKRFTKGQINEYLFGIFWLLFEYVHLNWSLSWPWLTLGNAFANYPQLAQWYSITGVLGGSAWILLVNILLYRLLKFQNIRRNLWAVLAVILVPSICSIGMFVLYTQKSDKTLDVVVLQPSFDPWNEKFDRDPADLIQEMRQISATALDEQVDLLVWPETSLTDDVNVENPEADYQVRMLREIQKQYPRLTILTGADMSRVWYSVAKRPSKTARPVPDSRLWWDAYNSAYFLDSAGKYALYHKSKLVPGTEQMPLTNWFPAINDLAVTLDENSVTGSLGSTDSAVVFGNKKIIPAICYESIYGDFLGTFAKKGGQLIAVITNDAWWGKTPGYLQHMAYARLRAVEQRKWVVRSANTGVSCFINPRGEVLQPTNWYEKKAIRHQVELNNHTTLYTKLGDEFILIFIACIFVFLGLKDRSKG